MFQIVRLIFITRKVTLMQTKTMGCSYMVQVDILHVIMARLLEENVLELLLRIVRMCPIVILAILTKLMSKQVCLNILKDNNTMVINEKDTLLEMVDDSYLPESMKNELKELISTRIKILG